MITIEMLPDPCPMDRVIERLNQLEGPTDLYTWYEGPTGKVADFLNEALFAKVNANSCRYSLKGWKFHKGEELAPFFRYALEPSPIYPFVQKMLPQKEDLIALSAERQRKKLTVEKFFLKQPSLFDCIKKFDVAKAYSMIQYIEGYFLIRESVKRGIYTIAFALPNDEAKYYKDAVQDYKTMLRIEFGETAEKIHVTFQFYLYGNTLKERPYL